MSNKENFPFFFVNFHLLSCQIRTLFRYYESVIMTQRPANKVLCLWGTKESQRLGNYVPSLGGTKKSQRHETYLLCLGGTYRVQRSYTTREVCNTAVTKILISKEAKEPQYTRWRHHICGEVFASTSYHLSSQVPPCSSLLFLYTFRGSRQQSPAAFVSIIFACFIPVLRIFVPSALAVRPLHQPLAFFSFLLQQLHITSCQTASSYVIPKLQNGPKNLVVFGWWLRESS